MPIIRDILYGAVNRGAHLDDLCAELSLTPAQLREQELKVDFDRAIHAWVVAVRATGDSFLGLHIGENTHATVLGLVGYLMQTSPTLKEAFVQVTRHSQLASDMFRYQMTELSKEEVSLEYAPVKSWVESSPATARQSVDQAMSGTLNVFQLLSGKKRLPVRVELAISKPAGFEEYERVYGCSPQFRKKKNALVFNREDLDSPVLSYDNSLFQTFSNLVEKKRGASESLSAHIRHQVLTEFGGQVPVIEIIASANNLTPRSLQRRLAEENTTYRELSSTIKEEIALQLLKNSKSKVSEVARMLGYSEASSFRRAFKTWTDVTPKGDSKWRRK